MEVILRERLAAINPNLTQKSANRFTAALVRCESSLTSDNGPQQSPGLDWNAVSNSEMQRMLVSVSRECKSEYQYNDFKRNLKVALETAMPELVHKWPTLFNRSGVYHPRGGSRGSMVITPEYAALIEKVNTAHPHMSANKCRYAVTAVMDAHIRFMRRAPWSEITNDEMSCMMNARAVELKRKSMYQFTSLLKLVLSSMFNRAECRTRWPCVFNPSYNRSMTVKRMPRRRDEPCLKNALGNDSGWLTKKIYIKSELSSIANLPTGIDAVTVTNIVNGVRREPLMCVPSAYYDEQFSLIIPVVRMLVLLRWGDGRDVLVRLARVFRYIQEAEDYRREHLVNLVRILYGTLSSVCPSGSLLDFMATVGRERFIELVNTNANVKRREKVRDAMNLLTHGGLFSSVFGLDAWAHIESREVQYRPKRRTRLRSSFTMEEVNRILEHTRQRPFDHALFRFYLHTGCRDRAGRILRLEDVWDKTAVRCRASGSVVEKFGVIRHFAIDPLLADALAAHIMSAGNLQVYVFPARSDPSRPLGKSTVSHWLKRLCAEIGIRGEHVYTHALRRTTVTLLRKFGNSTEDIRVFIGHGSIAMTEKYIDPSQMHAALNLRMPWLPHDLAMPLVTEGAIKRHAEEEEEGAQPAKRPKASSSSCDDTASSSNPVMIRMLDEMCEMQNAIKRLMCFYNRGIEEMTPVQRANLQRYIDEYDESSSNLSSSASSTAEPQQS